MKKAISEAKVQRMRNLVTGKYKAKTATQIGYKKQTKEYKEGDVWEERGKTWTIKNGIKQNITKLDAVRKYVRTPLCCPKCGNRMTKRLDKKFYRLRGWCFDCNTEAEHKMRIEGTYNQYERETIGKKLDTMYENVKDGFQELVESAGLKKIITEAGTAEDWSGGLSKKQYQDIVDNELKELKEKIDNFKKEGETK